MGCSESQPAPNENEAIIISKENSANGTSDQLQPVITDRIETTENSLQDSNGVMSPQGNQLNSTNDKPVDRPVKESSLKRSRTRRQSDGKFAIENNAWGVAKAKKNDAVTCTRPAQEELVDFGSEYGKDGVDLASSRVHSNDQDTEKLMSSSPDGTFHVDDYSKRMSKQQSIHKEDSDETFDPSALIDIEKFKAANAPAKETLTSNADIGTSKVEADENHNEYDMTANTTNHTETEVVVSPPNYNEFYDDDEKQLIDSIENDFKATSPLALPGSVL